jgi:hypothetical protein
MATIGAKQLVPQQCHLTALQVLNLVCNGIGDDGARQLGLELDVLTALQELKIS